MNFSQKARIKRALIAAGHNPAELSAYADHELMAAFNALDNQPEQTPETDKPEPADIEGWKEEDAPEFELEAEQDGIEKESKTDDSKGEQAAKQSDVDAIKEQLKKLTEMMGGEQESEQEAKEEQEQEKHASFNRVLRQLRVASVTNTGWPYLCGPAGSGKTTLAFQLADALGVNCYAKESLQDKFELLGFVDANGNYIESDLYRAFKHGGVFLFDEMDRSAADAVVAFNMAIANAIFTFPNGEQVKRHKKCYVIGAGNTFGTGASRAYSSAKLLDGSTRNRFHLIHVDYCEKLERKLAHESAAKIASDYKKPLVDRFVDKVQKARSYCRTNQLEVIFSPRQSMTGAALIADGMTIEEISAEVFTAELTEQQIQQAGLN